MVPTEMTKSKLNNGGSKHAAAVKNKLGDGIRPLFLPCASLKSCCCCWNCLSSRNCCSNWLICLKNHALNLLNPHEPLTLNQMMHNQLVFSASLSPFLLLWVPCLACFYSFLLLSLLVLPRLQLQEDCSWSPALGISLPNPPLRAACPLAWKQHHQKGSHGHLGSRSQGLQQPMFSIAGSQVLCCLHWRLWSCYMLWCSPRHVGWNGSDSDNRLGMMVASFWTWRKQHPTWKIQLK